MSYSRWFEMHSMDISINSTEGLWRCMAHIRPSRENRVITILNAPEPFNSGWRKSLEEAVYACYERASKYQFLDKIRK
jgi:DNA-binding cell septation regulator SpoVG